MKACEQCGTEVSESEMYISGDGEICASCQLDSEIFYRRPALSSVTLTALVGGFAPFFMTWHYSSASTFNGVVTSYTYVDYIALTGGPIAIVAGLMGMITGIKASNKLQGIGIPFLAVLLGVVQIFRGFGMI